MPSAGTTSEVASHDGGRKRRGTGRKPYGSRLDIVEADAVRDASLTIASPARRGSSLPGRRRRCSTVVLNRTSRSGAGNGSGRRKTPSITLNMAVLAAMPSAIASITETVTMGARRAMRHAYRRSLPSGLHGSVPSSRVVPHGAIDCRRNAAADEGAYGQAGLLPVPATGRGNPGGRGQLVEFLLQVAGEESLVPVSGQQAHQQRRKPGRRRRPAVHHRCPPPKSGERSCIIRASMAVECRSARVPAAVRA